MSLRSVSSNLERYWKALERPPTPFDQCSRNVTKVCFHMLSSFVCVLCFGMLLLLINHMVHHEYVNSTPVMTLVSLAGHTKIPPDPAGTGRFHCWGWLPLPMAVAMGTVYFCGCLRWSQNTCDILGICDDMLWYVMICDDMWWYVIAACLLVAWQYIQLESTWPFHIWLNLIE